MKLNRLVFLTIFFLAACSGKESIDQPKHFFDLRGYFDKEAKRLQLENPIIQKTVSQNTDSEEKQLRLNDWKTELELFAESDINKPAWKDSYRIIQKGLVTQYLAKDPDLKTRKILIRMSDKTTISQISIVNKSDNALYSSIEQLDYFPDSLYSIQKKQNVRVIGENFYAVSARLKN